MGAAWRSLAVVQRLGSRLVTRGLNATGLAKTVRAARARCLRRAAASRARCFARRCRHRLTAPPLPLPLTSPQLSDTASSRWYLLIECLPHVLGSIALRFLLADVLGLELFAVDVVSGFANSAIFVIAIMLAGVLEDYKESEGFPAEIAAHFDSM